MPPTPDDDLLRTARLDLHRISVPDLVRMFEAPGSPEPWAGKPYANPHRVLMDDLGPLPWRVPVVRRDPAQNRWFVRLIVRRDTGVVVGNIGFHGPPDERGMIEIGLEVTPSQRGRGFATEAVLGMWRWAVAQPGIAVLRWSVGPENDASIAIVESFGGRKVGEQMDEIDGRELVYELPAEEFRLRWSMGPGPRPPR
jgi:ribosomal-protein-alanine N-acetyltransferase